MGFFRMSFGFARDIFYVFRISERQDLFMIEIPAIQFSGDDAIGKNQDTMADARQLGQIR
jgi:hypothetical protein